MAAGVGDRHPVLCSTLHTDRAPSGHAMTDLTRSSLSVMNASAAVASCSGAKAQRRKGSRLRLRLRIIPIPPDSSQLTQLPSCSAPAFPPSPGPIQHSNLPVLYSILLLLYPTPTLPQTSPNSTNTHRLSAQSTSTATLPRINHTDSPSPTYCTYTPTIVLAACACIIIIHPSQRTTVLAATQTSQLRPNSSFRTTAVPRRIAHKQASH